jgi:hypothetical protein
MLRRPQDQPRWLRAASSSEESSPPAGRGRAQPADGEPRLQRRARPSFRRRPAAEARASARGLAPPDDLVRSARLQPRPGKFPASPSPAPESLFRPVTPAAAGSESGLHVPIRPRKGTHPGHTSPIHKTKTPRFTGVFEADEGTRTLDLLHGKDWARADRRCREVTDALDYAESCCDGCPKVTATDGQG